MEFTNPEIKGFTVYSKSGCPSCTKIKNYLKEKNFLYTEINCDEYILENREEFIKFMEEISGQIHRSYPKIFYDGKIIGGLTETIDFIDKLLLSFEEFF